MTSPRNMRYFNADLGSLDQRRSAPERRSGLKVFGSSKQIGNNKMWIKKEKTDEEKEKLKQKRKEIVTKQKAKKSRLIIRNLSFKVNKEELKNIFSEFGKVVDVQMPKKPDGRKKGFAFVQFEDFKSTILAMKKLNYKEIHGRQVALDYAIGKNEFQHSTASRKISEIVKEEALDSGDDDDSDSAGDNESELDEKPVAKDEIKSPVKQDKVSKFLKELEFNPESDDEEEQKYGSDDSSSESSEEDEEDSDGDENEMQGLDAKKRMKSEPSEKDEMISAKPGSSTRVQSNDVQEGKTVFVRNISFETCEEDFKEAMEEFGSLKYCLFCIDKLTDHPRGTAFVKFENKEDADKLIDKSNSDDGLFLDGRRLNCVTALSREEIREKSSEKTKEMKDKRNLRLLREGLVTVNSDQAEGVSQADLAKRTKLEMMKKKKLKNLNFFVSDKRLTIHNLPETFSDTKLRKLFAEAAGKGAIITEARVMKDFQKVNEKGESKSKGFGFVSFAQHEHALKALHSINNNPSIFSKNKRPIVGFSVENHMALLKRERQKERSKLRNKRRKESQEKDMKKVEVKTEKQVKSAKRKKNAQKGQKKKKKATAMNDKAFSNLVDKYKGKLLDKLK